jgi:ubiquinone/menaquinone biosynthesis C-methylase UbiE
MGDEKAISAFFDRRAADYLKRSNSGLWLKIRRFEERAVSEALKPQPGQRLLELGCGAGYYARKFAENFQMEVLAVDSSPRMLDGLSGGLVRTKLSSIDALELSETFDSVLAAGVLEFISDFDQVFRLAFSSLESGGKFVVLIPRGGCRGLLYKYYHWALGCPSQVRSFGAYFRAGAQAGFVERPLLWRTPISDVLCFQRGPSWPSRE